MTPLGERTIVGIHQPNYLPWPGYFAKIARCHRFVLLDDAPFTKHGYQNRVRIRIGDRAAWLTQPVLVKGRFGQPTHRVEFRPGDPWRDRHLKTLAAAYGRAPAYPEMEPWLSEAIRAADGERMAPVNEALIREVCGRLGIATEIVRATDLGGAGSGTERLVDLVRRAGGDAYLSGAGGDKYQDESVFAAAGVALLKHEFTPPVYPQRGAWFLAGLSIVDLLFEAGIGAARRICGAP